MPKSFFAKTSKTWPKKKYQFKKPQQMLQLSLPQITQLSCMEAELQIFIARKMKVLHSLGCNLDAILAKRELFFNISIILPYFLHISSCITCNNCFTINSYKISNLIFVKKRILQKTNLLCSLYDSFLCSDSTIIH